MSGRKSKPTALKIAQGNPGGRPLNKNEPKPSGLPECPSTLDEEAKVEWERISKQLVAMGLLTSVDRAALAAYCTAWSHFIEAEANVQKFGMVIKSPRGAGFPIQNPYLGISNIAMTQMRQFLIEFGMSPASRSRLNVTGSEFMEDPFETFMKTISAEPTLDVPNVDLTESDK